MSRIMLVDDEENILRALRRVLAADDWEIETYTQPADALRRAQVANFDLFLSDYRMPGMDGVQFLEQARQLQPEAMRIVLSGQADLDGVLGAINRAAIFRFISKPWQDSELKLIVQQALDYRAMLIENRRLADLVRRQREELDQQKSALEHLAAQHPELTRVNWGPDGSILLDDDEPL